MPVAPYDVIYKDQNDFQAIKYSNPQFIHSWVSGVAFGGQFKVNGLQAGVDYTMYCYGENLNRLSSSNYLNIEFSAKGLIRSSSAHSDIHFADHRQVSRYGPAGRVY
jgi:hypothetical protein